MFVLDEPSIGLHPRDMNRIVEAMHRLRDAGNTLVVVEHDPAVMLAADRLIDMGPGPGERGGQIVFDGTPDAVRRADTLTGAYLGGKKHVHSGIKRFVTDATPKLVLEGAREHNLKGVTIEFPLQRLVAVTGVSGSGKSTLMQDVLYPALARAFGKATETPGMHERLLGADWLSDAVFVDQSPIGKTARSNPASYVGAFDAMRALFADAAMAKERGYGAGMFSFNAGDGRCPTCGGSGFEHVEMQFLSDVYLRCPDCDGRRFRAEILDVKIVRGDQTAERRRHARPDRERSGASVCRGPRGDQQTAADRRCRPRLCAPRPAGADAVGRRGAAPEARRFLGASGRAAGATCRQQRHAVFVRRADDGAALRRHRQADARAAQAARRRAFGDHDRAQPRRDPRGGLGHRPRAGRRRSRRRTRVRRHAGRDQAASEFAHRQGVDGLRSGARHRAARRRRPAAAKRDPCGACAKRRGHPHRQRARAQPEVDGCRYPARQVLRHHGRVGFGQEHAGLRHPVQRRPAAVSRIAQRLCAQHRAAGGAAGGRCGVRHPADGGDRAAAVARRAQEHGGHRHRGLAFPAPAVGQARHPALRQGRHRGRAAEHREHRGAIAARSPRPACRA